MKNKVNQSVIKNLFLIICLLFIKEALSIENQSEQKIVSEIDQNLVKIPDVKIQICHYDNEERSKCVESYDLSNGGPVLKTQWSPELPMPQSISEKLNLKLNSEIKKGKYTCLHGLVLENDNPQMFRIKVSDPRFKGDDFGYTHGLGLVTACTNEEGIQTQFSYSTKLFTQIHYDAGKNSGVTNGNNGIRISRSTVVDQDILNETILSIFQDNKLGNTSYWKRGIGFVLLNSNNNLGMFQASEQQLKWHEILNNDYGMHARIYNDIDGSYSKEGAFVAFFRGLQETYRLTGHLSLNFSSEAGLQLSNLKKYNSLSVNTSAELKLTLPKGLSTSIYALENVQRDLTGNTVSIPELGISTQISKCRASFGMAKPIGERNLFDGKSVYLKDYREPIYKLSFLCGTSSNFL